MKIVLFSFLLLLSFSACTKLDPPQGERKRGEYPDLNYQDSITLEQVESNKLKWRLKALSLRRWPSQGNKTQIYGLSMDLYDSLGQITAWVRADSAIITNSGDEIRAYGSTRARSPKNLEISADSLLIQRGMNSIRTESPVRVLTPQGDLLTGVGLQSDLKLENWHLQNNVKAIFQDFGPRIDSASKASSATPTSPSSSSVAQATPNKTVAPKSNSFFGPKLPVNAPPRRPNMDAPDVE